MRLTALDLRSKISRKIVSWRSEYAAPTGTQGRREEGCEDHTGSPAISVGIPVFNGADYVAEAITSILGQTDQDPELLIQDNASTDRRRFAANWRVERPGSATCATRKTSGRGPTLSINAPRPPRSEPGGGARDHQGPTRPDEVGVREPIGSDRAAICYRRGDG